VEPSREAANQLNPPIQLDLNQEPDLGPHLNPNLTTVSQGQAARVKGQADQVDHRANSPEKVAEKVGSCSCQVPPRSDRWGQLATRVLRASLPLQLLLLLLLGAGTLLPGIPEVEEEFSCFLLLNGNREPILDYPHGPPPI